MSVHKHSLMVFLLILFMPLQAHASKQPVAPEGVKSFRGIQYAYVKVYTLNLSEETRGNHCRTVYDELGKQCNNIADTGIILSEAQEQTLLGITEEKNRYKRRQSKCWTPRHAWVFYNANHKMVAEYTLCLECKRDRIGPASIRGEGLNLRRDVFARAQAFCTELGLPRCEESK